MGDFNQRIIRHMGKSLMAPPTKYEWATAQPAIRKKTPNYLYDVQISEAKCISISSDTELQS